MWVQKSATVTKNGETTAKFGDCCTFALFCESHFSATVRAGGRTPRPPRSGGPHACSGASCCV